MSNSIESVRSFWDENPLLVGEIKYQVGSENWFKEFDRIKTDDIFCGDLHDWVPKGLIGKKVLDIGCGPGYWNRIFGKMDLEYFGIDISPKTVELAKESKTIFETKGEIAEGNAESLQFKTGEFDFVVSEGVIHHTPDTQKCIDEIYRVLKKGGVIGLYYKNFILRSPFLFSIVLSFMRILSVSLKGRKREGMVSAKDPDDFVRMYDGGDNPIGKAYSKTELRKMFSRFASIEFVQYYFPARALKIGIPNWLHRLLAKHLGLMY